MRGIVGTAGHIDHGKTALIGALTGEHTDRLPEEKERGISIDLGFTKLETPAGTLGVVDVPGHEDFIRNMLAGATGIDVLLLVVAADEGVMPQTREHVAIAGLLEVDQAVVALTKADLVDDDWLGLVREDVADFLAGTAFADAPVIATSATTGAGVEAVRQAIGEVFAETRGRPADLFRLPVDRTFTVRGTGTVVTGTVWSGRLREGAAVRLLPGGREARVRGLQVHGEDVDAIEAGQRAAIALAGVDRAEVARGETVVDDAGWAASSRLTASLRVLAGRGWRIEPWQRVRVHLGTAEVMARTVLLEDDALEPGEQGLVQLRLETPLVARGRDRFVVRSYSPVTTIGGGVVIEPAAPKRARLETGDLERFMALLGDDPTAAVAARVRAGGGDGVAGDRLPVDTGAPPDAVADALVALEVVRVGDRVFGAEAVAALRQRVLGAVDAHHRERPLQPGADPEAVRRTGAEVAHEALVDAALEGLVRDGVLAMRRGRLARPGFAPSPTAEDTEARDAIRARLANGLDAPRLDEVGAELGLDPQRLDDLVRLMEAEGDLVRVEHDYYVDADIMADAIRRVRTELGGRAGLSPGEFRDILGISRRHLIPVLEYFDRTGVTVRSGEGRTVPEQGSTDERAPARS